MANDLNIVYKIAADISGLQKGVERAASATEKLQATAVKVGAAFGVAFSAQAVIGFGKELIADAEALVRLSDKTGLSFQALQKFQIAGDDAGNSIEELTSAIVKLEDKLAGGDRSAMAALERMGLHFEDIKNLNPANQFIAISDAIRQIQDPAEQVNLAIDLFGRNGPDVLATLKRGFDDLKDASVGMSDETILAMEEFGDIAEAVWRKAKGEAAELAVGLIHLAQDGFWFAGHEARQAAREMAEINAQLERMAKTLPAATRFQPAAPLKVPTGVDATAAQDAQDKKLRKTFDDLNAAAKRAAADGLAKAQRAQEAFTDSVTDATEAMNLSVFSLHRFGAFELPNVSSGFEEARRQTEGWIEPLQDATGEVEDLQREGRFLAAALQAIGDTPMQLPDVHSSLEGVGDDVDGLDKAINQATFDMGDLANSFTQLAQVSGTSWGAAEQGIGSVIVSVGGMQKAMQALDDEIEKNGTAAWQSYASAGTAAFGVLMTGYGLLFDYINKKNAESQRNFDALHNAVVDFDERAAQFQFTIPSEDWVELNQKLQTLFQMDPKDRNGIAALSAEIETLISKYEKLAGLASSKYGPNANELKALAADAHATFDYMLASGLYSQSQLDAAFLDFQKALAATGDAAAKAWLEARGEIDATGKSANAALDALTKRRDDIAGSYANEAPEEVMGSIEAAARAQVAALDQQIQAEQDRIDKLAAAAAATVTEKVGGAGDQVGDKLKDGITDGLSGAGPAADDAKTAIERTFAEFRIEIPFEFYQVGPGAGSGAGFRDPNTPLDLRDENGNVITLPDGPGPVITRPGPIYFAGGGIAHSYGLEPWSLDGLRGPRGIDTIPAWLSEGETVRTPRQEAALHGGGDERPIVVENHNTLMLDGQIVAENFITRAQHDKRGAGTKLKKVLGIPQ